MKIVLVVLGLPLMFFGLVMSLGTIVGLTEGTSDYSVTTDIIGLVCMGIVPLVIGLGLLVTGIALLLRERSVKERNDSAA